MPEVVAVLGSTGFVGRAVAAELGRRGIEVRPVAAPRLSWPHGLPHQLGAVPAGTAGAVVAGLARRLAGVSAVVNAAGRPDGTAPASPQLYGADALLPALVARAAALAGAHRYVHLSSAAVQGGEPGVPLDETPRTAPFSPYSRAKALGERLVLAEPPPAEQGRDQELERVLFRATWVHDAGRPSTCALARLARSPASWVAGDGTAATPQVLIDDIAASVSHLALAPGPVPPIVLQPSNGMTTGLLLRLLGGREPRHIPQWLARAAVVVLRGYGRCGLRANAHARRAEMLLFGRAQVDGWLAGQGVIPRLRPEVWQRLASAPTGRAAGPVSERV